MKSYESFISQYCDLTQQDFDWKFEESQNIPKESFDYSETAVRVSDNSGVRNAINIINFRRTNQMNISEGIHSPSFAIRGVIEGFYGTQIGRAHV